MESRRHQLSHRNKIKKWVQDIFQQVRSDFPQSHTRAPSTEPKTSAPRGNVTGEIHPRDYWGRAIEHIRYTDPGAFERFRKLKDSLGAGTDFSAFSQARLEEALLDATARKKRSRPWRLYQRCARAILQYKELATGLAGLDPHRIAPVVVNGVCVLLQASIAEGTLSEQAVSDIEKISLKLARWSNIEAEIPSHDVNKETPRGRNWQQQSSIFENLENHIVQFYSAVLEWQSSSLLDQKRGDRLVHLLRIEDLQYQWKEAVRKIKSQEENCTTAYQNAIHTFDRSLEIRKWICPVNPIERHEALLEQTKVDSTYRDCGQWLIESKVFKTWYDIEAQDRSNCLWIRGTVGTGKTTLMLRLIQYHLDRSSHLGGRRIAYYYCSRRGGSKVKGEQDTMMQTLLSQLGFDHSRYRFEPLVVDAFNEFKIASRQNSPSGSRCLEMIRSLLKEGARARILIDALEECEDYRAVLHDLRSLNDEADGRLDILVSSRAEVDVQKYLQDCALIDVNESTPSEELEQYITMEIKKPDKLQRVLEGKREDLEDQLIEALLCRAGSMFLYAQLQISLFTDQRKKWTHPDDVKSIIERLRRGTVSKQDLNSTYGEILKRNMGDEHERPRRYYHARQLYQLILAAFMPFTMDMLVGALSFGSRIGDEDPNIDAEYIRDLARDVLIESRSPFFNGRVLEFAHASVKEHLKQREEFNPVLNHLCMLTSLWPHLSLLQDPSKSTRGAETDQLHLLLAIYGFFMWTLHWSTLRSLNQEGRFLASVGMMDVDFFGPWWHAACWLREVNSVLGAKPIDNNLGLLSDAGEWFFKAPGADSSKFLSSLHDPVDGSHSFRDIWESLGRTTRPMIDYNVLQEMERRTVLKIGETNLVIASILGLCKLMIRIALKTVIARESEGISSLLKGALSLANSILSILPHSILELPDLREFEFAQLQNSERSDVDEPMTLGLARGLKEFLDTMDSSRAHVEETRKM